jgi:hypothetical protein
MEKKLINYESPLLEVAHIDVEGPLASSGPETYLDYKKNPSMSYGDEGEQWF